MACGDNRKPGEKIAGLKRDEIVMFYIDEGLSYREICSRTDIKSTATITNIVKRSYDKAFEKLTETAKEAAIGIYRRSMQDLDRIALLQERVDLLDDVELEITKTCDLMKQRRSIHSELIEVLNIHTIKIESDNKHQFLDSASALSAIEEFQRKSESPKNAEQPLTFT